MRTSPPGMNMLEQMACQNMEAAKHVTACRDYAESIGCILGTDACFDEITCLNEEQWDAMRKWWTDHA